MEAFTLRTFNPTDRDTLAELANNARIAANMTNQFPHPFETKHAEAFIQRAMESPTSHMRAIALNGRLIGGVGLHMHDDVHGMNAEVGYWLGEAYWGNGYATEAVRLHVAWGWKHLNVNRLFGRVFSSNPASAKVLEKNGFVHEGTMRQAVFKNGVFCDEHIYSQLRSEATLADLS